MQYVCDAPDGYTWFRLETENEAFQESELMKHAVEKHFRQAREAATASYKPTSTVSFEENIGLEAHIQKKMPLFVTLRDSEGAAHVTAMLPPDGEADSNFRIIIVGPDNDDPYPEFSEAIEALSSHLGLTLDREVCFPYQR